MIIIFIQNRHRLLVRAIRIIHRITKLIFSYNFAGFNAPLYARSSERSIFATLNINASAMYWHLHGLDKNKIVIGLPTYGHSFRYAII